VQLWCGAVAHVVLAQPASASAAGAGVAGARLRIGGPQLPLPPGAPPRAAPALIGAGSRLLCRYPSWNARGAVPITAHDV